jgi:hypothetical protein
MPVLLQISAAPGVFDPLSQDTRAAALAPFLDRNALKQLGFNQNGFVLQKPLFSVSK